MVVTIISITSVQEITLFYYFVPSQFILQFLKVVSLQQIRHESKKKSYFVYLLCFIHQWYHEGNILAMKL